MDNLNPPTPELISKILHEVDYKDRFIGSSMHERAGVKTVSIYNMKELLVFLNMRMPLIDLNQLELWIRLIIKDEHLANKLKFIFAEEISDLNKLQRIREVVRIRIGQCL
jgi:hypothetical protein